MKQYKSLQSIIVGIALACSIPLLFIYSSAADPLYVSLDSAQYITYVEAQGSPVEMYPPISRTTVSSTPISDEIDQPMTDMWPGVISTNYAIANAGLFEVSDQTGWGFANAEAVSQLWFTPLTDQIQTIGIQIFARGSINEHPWTAGEISLFDLTANSQLCNYSWAAYWPAAVPVQIPFGDNVPWNSDDQNADLNLTTQFLASHQYQLTLIAYSNAGSDDEVVQIQLSGLQPVPEPSPVFLDLLCGATLFICRACSGFLRRRTDSVIRCRG